MDRCALLPRFHTLQVGHGPGIGRREEQGGDVGYRGIDVVRVEAPMKEDGLPTLAGPGTDPPARVDLLQERDDAVMVRCRLPDVQVGPVHRRRATVREVAVGHTQAVRSQDPPQLLSRLGARSVAGGSEDHGDERIPVGQIRSLRERGAFRVVVIHRLRDVQLEGPGIPVVGFDLLRMDAR